MDDKIIILKPRKALNKAFLKVKPARAGIEQFKTNLIQLIDRINDHESEEFHKNLVSDFLKKTYYEPAHYINTKGRNDLVIHTGDKATSPVGVIVEAKKPANKAEMLSRDNINAKALQELVLYYLRERIHQKNIEVKHLIVTNIYEWFVFDATLFDRLFAQNKDLAKQYNDFENGRLADTKTDFFYKNIAEPFIAGLKHEMEYTWFDIRDYDQALRNHDKNDDNQLIALYKLLSPEHLLKLPFVNDSNSLDKRFYGELLHIIGLLETREGSKKLIERNKEGQRNAGSLLENAINQLDSLDKISRLQNPGLYGSNHQERLFNIALELSITWINRILFLKLLEAQLIRYHRSPGNNGKGDKSFEFLNSATIRDYDNLNRLFFQVLARRQHERSEDIRAIFSKIPYLNSSLFEPTDLEHSTVFISNLLNDKPIPIYSATVLKDESARKRSGTINPLEYLFEFLNSYDFASEGSEEIQEDNKTLINASVLGLIFEKINGYKDGSFFTPGFITMYMCRETIRRAVVQKFNELKKWSCTDLDSLYDKIEDRSEANRIINSLKICDPAVGSGHFLVSALNEIVAIKSDLKILQDLNGRRLKEYQFEVINDELIVTDENGELLEYNPNNQESQRVQEALFHEKQTIIENCLFGVDINPNSVKICRLRLWIELLKNAYYKSSSPEKGRWPQAGGVNSHASSHLPQAEGGGGFFASSPTPNPLPPTEVGYSINNLPYLKTFRRELRNNLTPAEAKLWTMLKGRGLEGRKFRRQHSVANYILDFYCPEERLAIELDGQGHFEASQAEYDRERDLFLLHVGIRVLRFENKWVWDNPAGLLEIVSSYFGKQPKSSSPEKGRWPEAGGVNSPASGLMPEAGGVNSPASGLMPEAGGVNSPDSNITPRAGWANQPPRPADTPPFKGGELLELETLPNIDINIKCGNSLVSRFAIDADLGQALKKSKWTIGSYRAAVDAYRNAQNKEQKREMERLIHEIKTNFRSEITQNDPKLKRLRSLSGELFTLTNQGQLFERSEKEMADWRRKVDKLTADIQKLEAEIETVKANKIYENAFEWRFEFPEVLDDNGDFKGFDVVIGNPPYGMITYGIEYFSNIYKTVEGRFDLFEAFIEKGLLITKSEGIAKLILPNTILTNLYSQKLRKHLLHNYYVFELTNFGIDIFEEATVHVCIIGIQNCVKSGLTQIRQQVRSKNELCDNHPSTVELMKLVDKISFTINISLSLPEIDLFTKINKHVTLNKICYIRQCIKTGNDLEYVRKSTTKLDEPWQKSLRGKGISRYSISEDNLYVKYGNFLARNWQNKSFYETPKIAVRETSNRIIAAIDLDNRYFLSTLYAIYPKEIFTIDYLKYLLGILNSTLATFFVKKIAFDLTEGAFTKVRTNQLGRLPIPSLPKIERMIGRNVDQILQLKSNNCDTSIIEAEIDRLVYQLYGLTEEEIAIIENRIK